jgi:L-xylulokinase
MYHILSDLFFPGKGKIRRIRLQTFADNLLAVDLGLSAVKAGVFAADGTLLHVAEESNQAVCHNPKNAAVDMNLLWRLAQNGIRKSLTNTTPSASIQAIGICGHGNGAYLVDRNGLGVCGVSSMDTRAETLLADWRKQDRAENIANLVGGHLWTGQPLAILAAMKDQLPPDLTLLFAKDYLRYRLTGRYVTDPGDASAAGLLDLQTGQWSQEATALAGVDGFIALPDLAESSCAITGTVTQQAADETGLVEGTPVVAGSIDLAMGAMGDGLSDDATLHVTAGTWGIHQLRRKERLHPKGILQTIQSPWEGDVLWVESSPTSAINLTWLGKLLQANDDTFAQWEKSLREEIRPADPLYLPYPVGCWDIPDQRAGLAGLTIDDGPEQMIRAVYEGIVLGHLRQIRKYLSLTNDIRRVIVTGGLTRSESWRRMLCDAVQLPVEIADHPHAALRGAAICAAKGICMDEFQSEPPQIHITPRRERKKHWQARYKMFSDILQAGRMSV